MSTCPDELESILFSGSTAKVQRNLPFLINSKFLCQNLKFFTGSNNEFSLSPDQHYGGGGVAGPPQYPGYQDSRRLQQQSPSCSLVSAPIYNTGIQPDRPRSVLSATGHTIRPVAASRNQRPPMFSNNVMNQSFSSAIEGGSPWPSQQQIDGEIVYVLTIF
jgi:hypothetical protein